MAFLEVVFDFFAAGEKFLRVGFHFVSLVENRLFRFGNFRENFFIIFPIPQQFPALNVIYVVAFGYVHGGSIAFFGAMQGRGD